MKEVTYGWYPSANDIYRSKGRPSTSQLECLYRHGDSVYYQGKMAAPPSELMIMGVSAGGVSTPQEQRSHRSKTVSVPKFKPVPKLHIPTPTECWNQATQKGVSETSWGVMGESSGTQHYRDVNWPLPTKKDNQQQQQLQQQQQIWRQQFTPQQQQQLLKEHLKKQKIKCLIERHPTPQYAWGLRKPQGPQENSRPLSPNTAGIKWPTAKHIPPARPQTSCSSQIGPSSARSQKPRPASSPVHSTNQKAESLKHTPAPPAAKTVPESNRPSRIQSATVRRERTPLPVRPQTASPRKQEISPRLPVSARKREVNSARVTRPVAPVPFVYDVNENVHIPQDDEEGVVQKDESFEEDEYEEIVKKYGWRAQVHGDPYKLKRPLPRMSYAVTCVEPDVPPEPPGIHMESNEPFFSNTIPNKPMTVEVDKEWISEVINAKRLELQKREGGIKYSYKNFSFVY